MVSYEDARDRALRAYGGFNRCTETEGAFIIDDDSYEGVALDLVFNEIRTFDI